ncbi:metallophosphoesterase [Candidatus Poribacteria bacterium]|nr:metallophosphoesterase [Candidatus Poribacteria bacterium]
MKYFILSDIHSNLEALQSVMFKSKTIRIDEYVFLGDLVGYGANPNQVVDIVKKLEPIIAVRGNHDKAAVELSDASDFNYAAKDAALWTRDKLSKENKGYVKQLSEGPVDQDDLFCIMHGSPWDEEYYILSPRSVYKAIEYSDKQVKFFGHTHIPVIWSLKTNELSGQAVKSDYHKLSIDEDTKYLINPGSVGQPRDNIPKASMVVFDTDKMEIEFFRLDYNIEETQRKIIKAELTPYLAERLSYGR